MSGAGRCVLVTGASGTLGGPLTVRAEAAGWEVVSTYLTRPERVRAGLPVQLDLRDRHALRDLVFTFRPEVIIHAAVTERSSKGFAEAIRTAARHVAEVAAETGGRLIALSTDLVFDGTEACYLDDTPPQPAANSAYGRAKADMERATLAIFPRALVARTSLIYDFDRENAQVAWMLRAIEQGETMRLYTDQLRCPIWAFNLADALLELAEMDTAGALNLVGPEAMSRYELGVALLEAMGFDPARHIVSVEAPDTHPKRLILDVERARTILKTPLLTVAQARARWQAKWQIGPG